MNVGPWRWLESTLRGLTPLVLTLAFVLLSVLHLPVPGFAPVTPWLSLMAVYYWSIYRPDLLPLVATFLLGLVQDSLSGTPLGLNVLVLLLVQGVVVSQRRFFHSQTFLVEWWGFMLVAPGAVLVSWVIVSSYHGVLVAPRPLVFQLLLTMALYPAITWLFARAQSYLLRPT